MRRLSRSSRIQRWVLIGAAMLAVVVALLVAGFIWQTPAPAALLRPDPMLGTLTLLDARGGALAELPDNLARSRHPVALSGMGADLPRITVALEDHRFYRHHGSDGVALLGAALRNIRAGRIVSGASTITEQLVKLAAGRPEGRTLSAKAHEAVAAWKVERLLNKADILERYLNSLSYGNRLVGPQAAARAYFNKDATALTLAEAVYLAGLPQAPTRFNPWRRPASAEFRYGRNVRRLAALGMLNSEEIRRLADFPPHPGRFLPVRRAGHFVDLVAARRHREGAPYPSEGFLRTTLDPDLQSVAETLTRRHLDDLRSEGDEDPQAAVVIIENVTGAVRALVGSGDYGDPHRGQVNGAVRPRSAGSTLKPFLYLTAFDRRLLTAASILPDTAEAVRVTFADYDPQNYHPGRRLGPVRVRVALGSSLNVPAVVALGRYVGARQAFYEFGRWGFRFPAGLDEYGAGFILGNAEIRLLDLANAYAGLARGGLAGPARLLARDGASLERVASAEACAIIADILCDPEARRATFGAGSPLDFPESTRVAVKTGTSSGFRDKWCVGFEGRHTVAVWAGHFDGRPMGESIGIHAAAPLWHALVDHLLRERGDPGVPAPVVGQGVVSRAVCPLTGLLPAPEVGGPAGIPEYYLAGTQPTVSAAEHYSPDPAGGAPHLLLPAEYAAWSRSPQNTLGAIVRPSPVETGTAEDVPVITIVSPPENARYTLDPELPVAQQMLELQADASDGAAVDWTVNDRPIPPQSDGRVFWPLVRGTWQLSSSAKGAKPVTRTVVVE